MLRIASPSTTSHVFYHYQHAFAFESLSFLVVNMPPWSLISPASRGIGFALARRVLQTTNAPVVVTARKNLAKAKKELLEGLDVDDGRLTMLEIDVLGMSLRPEDIVVKQWQLAKPYRRIQHQSCSCRLQGQVSNQLPPTPARFHCSRTAVPREITCANRC